MSRVDLLFTHNKMSEDLNHLWLFFKKTKMLHVGLQLNLFSHDIHHCCSHEKKNKRQIRPCDKPASDGY